MAGAGGPPPDALAAEAQAARNARTEQELVALGALGADAWESEVTATWQRLGFRLSPQQDEPTGRRYLVGVDPDNRVTCFYLAPAGRALTGAEVAWCARLARGRHALAGVVITRDLVTSRALHRMARRGAVQIQDPLDFAMFRHFLNAQPPETLVRFGGAYSFIIIEPSERCH
jgi:sugar/nucleoside kinase (ribokinase family)